MRSGSTRVSLGRAFRPNGLGALGGIFYISPSTNSCPAGSVDAPAGTPQQSGKRACSSQDLPAGAFAIPKDVSCPSESTAWGGTNPPAWINCKVCVPSAGVETSGPYSPDEAVTVGIEARGYDRWIINCNRTGYLWKKRPASTPSGLSASGYNAATSSILELQRKMRTCEAAKDSSLPTALAAYTGSDSVIVSAYNAYRAARDAHASVQSESSILCAPEQPQNSAPDPEVPALPAPPPTGDPYTNTTPGSTKDGVSKPPQTTDDFEDDPPVRSRNLAVGVGVGVAVIAIGAYFFFRRRKAS